MIKTTLPLVTRPLRFLLSLACEKKSEQQKKVEATTEQAVKTGEMSKDQAKEVNKAAEKMEDAAQDARKALNDMVEKLDKAKTGDEIKEAIREVTKKNLETMVKAGQLQKEQADQMLINMETGMANLTEEQLRAQVEQLKQTIEQMGKSIPTK